MIFPLDHDVTHKFEFKDQVKVNNQVKQSKKIKKERNLQGLTEQTNQFSIIQPQNNSSYNLNSRNRSILQGVELIQMDQNDSPKYQTVERQIYKRSQKPKKQKKLKVKTYTSLFLMNVVAITFTYISVTVGLFTDSSNWKIYYLNLASNLGCFVFLLSLFVISQSFKHMFLMLTLLDNLLLTMIVADIGFLGLLKKSMPSDFIYTFFQISFVVMNFFMAGSIRMHIKYMKWCNKRIVLFKILVLTGAICYFMIGSYIMFMNVKFTKGLSPTLDSELKDFALLFTFSNFSFFAQVFAKVSDFDGTADLETTYQIRLCSEEQCKQHQILNDQINQK